MKVLITADWHVKGERPICRTDDNWIESQRKTISQIREVFLNNGCDQIWILGDLFDAPKCSTASVNMLIVELKKFPFDSVKILCGNHDLKDHNYGNLEDCSIGTLKHLFADIPGEIQDGLGCLTKVSARPFGLDEETTDANVVCTHQLTFPNAEARPIEDCGVLAQDLLDKWRSADLIFTGDYHHAFIHEFADVVKGRNRYVVNPGCINIQKADELDYEPSVVVWDASSENPFEKFYLDPQRENCTRDHIEAREHKEEEFERVVETIKGNVNISLDFDSNLESQVQRTDSAIIDEYNIMRQTINGDGK